jgi:hypothetical protein
MNQIEASAIRREGIEGRGEETGNNCRNQSRGRRERGAVLRQRNAERRPTGPEESAGWRGAHLGAFYSRGGGGGVAWRQRNPYRTRRRAGVGAGVGAGLAENERKLVIWSNQDRFGGSGPVGGNATRPWNFLGRSGLTGCR